MSLEDTVPNTPKIPVKIDNDPIVQDGEIANLEKDFDLDFDPYDDFYDGEYFDPLDPLFNINGGTEH